MLEAYLNDLHDVHATGEAVKETSFYPALSNLLNAVGAELKPRVRAIINMRNRGAGLPDGGLFTAHQLKKLGGDEALDEPEAFKGQQPERGVIEVKSASEDVRAVAHSEQVARYLRHYGQVLVTNLREFLLVGREEQGALKLLEGYALADSEKDFWKRAQNPREFAKEHETRLVEYLKRVMLSRVPLDAPESLAWFLASYARDAKARIEQVALPSLKNVRDALEQALGLKFEGEQGERFFRSTLVQTLFYGVFSSWVLWSKSAEGRRRESRFDWQKAVWTLRVPVISALFEQVVTPSNVRGLRLEEVLDWTADALNRVEREKFFERFEQEHAVQYFYEPFLEAFDPELRKQLGVWYTPTEIVRYMVECADRCLREELKIENGLADERVYVLDPCCGTGAYLVETLRRIKQTIDEQGGDALMGADLKRAATGRVFGFEILPAPFVVAHLQLGLLLQTEGSPLAEGERVGVFLTNALVGWEPPREPKKQLPLAFHALEEERDAAEEVKQQKKILVLIGNPPYNAFAGTSAEEEGDIIAAYKAGLVKEWGIKKFNLDDLYVRFFRLAERRIAEMTGKGIVCFISNFSYLSDPSFVVMRQRFLREFDKLWFDSLNGDSRETGKLTPEGKPDPSVFSTPYNREGIRVGTAIGLMVRKEQRDEKAEVRTREFWGIRKRQDLLASLEATDLDAQYTLANPTLENRYSFRPSSVGAHYLAWAKLTELCAQSPFNGPVERRALALISMDRDALASRMKSYFDNEVSDEEVKQIYPSLMMDGNRIVGTEARKKVLSNFDYDESRIVHYPFKPFDVRWCYLENLRPLFSEPSPQLLQQRFKGNAFLISRDTADKDPEGSPFFYSSLVCDYDCISGHARHFPIFIKPQPKKGNKNDKQSSLLVHTRASESETVANLSARARQYLAALGITDVDENPEHAALIWMHALAIGYAPAYLEENRDGIRADFPRVPLPATREMLEQSTALGSKVAALLDTETTVSGVTSGAIRVELRHIARISRADGSNALLNPQGGDLELRAGWGHKGKGGVVMPGKGRTRERAYTDVERETCAQFASQNNLTLEEVIACLGETTHDVFLNDVAMWSNIPARVWSYTIGGYQVIKKWLSYRELEILGRSLTADEAREVTLMARRIAAILLLEPQLNENYERAKAAPYAWAHRVMKNKRSWEHFGSAGVPPASVLSRAQKFHLHSGFVVQRKIVRADALIAGRTPALPPLARRLRFQTLLTLGA